MNYNYKIEVKQMHKKSKYLLTQSYHISISDFFRSKSAETMPEGY